MRARVAWFSLALLLVACDSSGGGDAGPGADTGVDVDATARSDGGGGVVALLDEALPCSPGPSSGVDEGTDLVRVTLSDPDAVCNDGSPAVIYVRPAGDAAAEDRWVFHLQGGGGCGGTNCAARWCGRNAKMTTRGAPNAMRASGIMRRDPGNRLGDANQVFLYYCSSDNWAGRAADAVIPAEGDTPAFRLHFRGDAIVDAALTALEAGVTSDDGAVTMPRLGGGGSALWTGTSGGCLGVVNTGDRFAVRMRDLGVAPALVCDANFGPTEEGLPAGVALDAHFASVQARHELFVRHANPNLDASCVAMHPSDPWRCAWGGYVMANHITEAPLFIRMSLADRAIRAAYVESGFTITEFAEGVRTGLLGAAAGGGLEPPPRPIGVYGPGCEQHVGLTNSDWFFDATVTEAGAEVSFHDALVAWLGGADVSVVDTMPPTRSTCAALTDETD